METCATYLTPYLNATGGQMNQIINPDATSDCKFCALSSTNEFLSSINSSYADRWRNSGLLWVYIVFNAVMAVFLYWLVRVPKKSKTKKAKKE
jgi:ABC-type multidrug transport system permease subunit